MAKLDPPVESKQTLRDKVLSVLIETPTLRDADLDLKKYPDRNVALAKATGEFRAKKIGKLRRDAVMDAYNARLVEVTPDNYVAVGVVKIYKMQAIGNNGVEIWTSPDGAQPDYRIFNPPTLVRDAQGTVDVGGTLHREDPLAAISEVIQNAIARERR